MIEEYLKKKFPLKDEVSNFKLGEWEKQKPKVLYKFMSLREDELNKLYSIRNNKIWITNACYLNDPFECAFKHKDIKCDIFSQEYKNFTNKVENISYEMKKETYIASMTEKKNSVLMWSHYGDMHRGICVEYDFDELVKCENINFILAPINYKKRIPEIYPEGNLNWLYRVYTTKAEEWNYEHEWRILKQEKEYKKGFLIDIIKPNCIYLGSEMDSNKKNQIEEYFQGTDIEIRHMYKHPYNYEIICIEDV